MDLVGRYIDSIDLDARGLVGRLSGAVGRLASRSVPAEERNPVYLLASEEQREVLDEIQAMMAVIEGHGNFVMDAVGAREIPSFRRMRTMFQRRREQTGAVQRAIGHLIGLEMKLRQYEMGQAFCEHVHAQGGPPALGHLWSGPEQLPTLAELREPERWLRRVA
jgi:putative hydrolase